MNNNCGIFKCLLILTICFSSVLALRCDHRNNVYYHKQLKKCLPCETCPVGYGKVSLEESNLKIHPVFGADKCIRCRPCKGGYFSDTDAYNCQKCTNCTILNKFEMQSCSTRENIHCSSELPLDIRKKSDDNKDIINENVNIPTDHKHDALNGIVAAVCICLLVSLGLAVFFYRKYKRTREESRQVNGSLENSVVVSIVEDDGTSESSDSICYSEIDETTPLIDPTTKTQKRRIRLYSEPIYTQDIQDVQAEMLTKGSSLSDLYQMENSGRHGHLSNSEFVDYSIVSKPHERLKSFGIVDNSILQRVREWEFKETTSFDKNTTKLRIHRKASSFIRQHAMHQIDALRKNEWWELRDDMLSQRFMTKVARLLGPSYKFRRFARTAGLSDTDLSIIQINNKEDVVEQGFQVLRKLKEKEIITKESDVFKIMNDLQFRSLIAKLRASKNFK